MSRERRFLFANLSSGTKKIKEQKTKTEMAKLPAFTDPALMLKDYNLAKC